VSIIELPAPPLPPGRPRLVVAGFMGTGKTEAGRRAAELLGVPFVDLDLVIESRTGTPVADIFARRGEEEFRRLERAAMADAARLSGAVIATGGGAVLDADSFRRVAHGATVVVLTCRPEEIERRLAAADPPMRRPLLADGRPERLRHLLESRAGAYAAAGEALDTTGRTVEEVAASLAERHRAAGSGGGSRARIDVLGPDGPYPVIVGGGELASLVEHLRECAPGVARAAVVADRAVDGTIGDVVAGSLASAGMLAGRLSVPSGESAKTIDVVQDLWREFVQLRLDRADAVVAVGGGTTTDVVGFAAATFGRGTSLVNVPTTLLGMVDAAIGGKTGIDHAGVKNSVGAFHHPRMVVADTSVLATLPLQGVREGLAEAIKAAVLASPLVLDVIEQAGSPETSAARQSLDWVVEQAVRIKAAYVAEDAADSGLRHSLNLGHTFAHGIESASDHAITHGQAVAIGLVAAARLGEEAGVTEPGTRDGLERVLGAIGLPTRIPPGLDAHRICHAMASDKKRTAGRAVFVVPATGGAALLDGVEIDHALEALTGVARP
jgi:shikimate kinase / 3-dehydroquinate synthase